jgi:hypothetical protein
MRQLAGARRLVASVCGALLGGCAGNGKGLDANGQPPGAGGVPPAPLTADFQSIQDNVFTPICVRCHSGAGAPQGLELDAAHSYALLVGVPSTEQPGVLRVKAGAPDSSYLVLKLEGSPAIVGAQMPFGGPPLPQATLDVIRQWITDGAQSSAAAAGADFAVLAIVPGEGAVVAAPMPQIIVAFTHEPDAALLNDSTVHLETRDGVPLAVSVQAAEGNPGVLLIVPRRALGAGAYRLMLRGTGSAALADTNGRVLASDYSREFTVEEAP